MAIVLFVYVHRITSITVYAICNCNVLEQELKFKYRNLFILYKTTIIKGSSVMHDFDLP